MLLWLLLLLLFLTLPSLHSSVCNAVLVWTEIACCRTSAL
jgi:hypothetical protein